VLAAPLPDSAAAFQQCLRGALQNAAALTRHRLASSSVMPTCGRTGGTAVGGAGETLRLRCFSPSCGVDALHQQLQAHGPSTICTAPPLYYHPSGISVSRLAGRRRRVGGIERGGGRAVRARRSFWLRLYWAQQDTRRHSAVLPAAYPHCCLRVNLTLLAPSAAAALLPGCAMRLRGLFSRSAGRVPANLQRYGRDIRDGSA